MLRMCCPRCPVLSVGGVCLPAVKSAGGSRAPARTRKRVLARARRSGCSPSLKSSAHSASSRCTMCNKKSPILRAGCAGLRPRTPACAGVLGCFVPPGRGQLLLPALREGAWVHSALPVPGVLHSLQAPSSG